MTDSPLLRPTPRYPFEITPTSTSADSSAPLTPDLSQTDPEPNEIKPTRRTHSILNLTSSTLFGIYSPSSYEGVREGRSTPWGTGAQTPLRQSNADPTKTASIPLQNAFPNSIPSPRASQNAVSFRGRLLPLTVRMVLLFGFGIAYGLIITHLHDSQYLGPVGIGNIHRASWRYLKLWGVAGVLLGGLLPWVDVFWAKALGEPTKASTSKMEPESMTSHNQDVEDNERAALNADSGLRGDWSPVVRSIGAFIGIAFAIRKLPWQSTLQESLTLALVNPVLWYIVDRSTPGFILSTFVGITGTTVLVHMNPEMISSSATPFPSSNMVNTTLSNVFHSGLISHESIEIWTWIASVLFCSSVCFGNIGRKLAFGRAGKKVNS